MLVNKPPNHQPMLSCIWGPTRDIRFTPPPFLYNTNEERKKRKMDPKQRGTLCHVQGHRVMLDSKFPWPHLVCQPMFVSHRGWHFYQGLAQHWSSNEGMGSKKATALKETKGSLPDKRYCPLGPSKGDIQGHVTPYPNCLGKRLKKVGV